MGYKILTPATYLKACDHFGHVLRGQADALVADHYQAIGLYPAACDENDLLACTAAGLGVWWILEGLATSTIGTVSLGATLARSGVDKVRSWGVPAGDTYFADLEGEGRPVQSWIDLAIGAGKVIETERSVAGAYIAEGTGLSAAQLYALPQTRYWKGAARVPEPECGWCMVQGFPIDQMHAGAGMAIDFDALWQDYHGRAVTLVVAG